MRKKTDYSIRCLQIKDWYVVQKGTGRYLFHDGRMRDWHIAIERYGADYINAETHFGSKSAASRALNRYLKGGKK